MLKKRFLFSIIVCVEIFLVLIVGIVAWAHYHVPKNKQGEFPFKLEYEINGERISVEDTLIIEYKRSYWSFELGAEHEFNVYCASQMGTEKVFRDYENLVLLESPHIEFMIGSCDYYMGLKEDPSIYDYISPGDIMLKTSSYTGPISDEELLEQYDIKIIEKYISSPSNPAPENIMPLVIIVESVLIISIFVLSFFMEENKNVFMAKN